MKKALVATVALALGLAAASPASADPARASSAAAFGLSATVLNAQLVAPTPTVAVSQPPDAERTRDQILDVPVPPLAVAGVATVTAEAKRESVLGVTLGDPAGIPAESDPTELSGVNARGIARTVGLGVVVTSDVPLDPALDPVRELIGKALVANTTVTAEAVAKCVDNKAQFDYGYDIIAVGAAGTKVDLADQIASTLIGVLGPATPTASILRVETPDNSPATTVVKTDDGISVTALRLVSDLLGTVIEVSHAEARMPTPCGIEQPKPTGPGPIAEDKPRLAATGGEMGTLPLVAFGVLGGAVILRRTMLRSYRRAS